MGTTPVTLNADATSLESAQANVLASSQVMAANLNANLKTLFLGAFNDWCTSVNAGRIPNTNPPQPPASFVVVTANSGWAFPEQNGTPIVDMSTLTIPPDRTEPPSLTLVANTIDVGAHLVGSWYAAGPQDTWPPNKQTPPVTLPDGSTHVFLKIPAPVGSNQVTLADGTVVVNGGWYEVVQ